VEVAEPLGELSDDVSGGHFGLSFHKFVDIRFGDLVQAERLEALIDEVVHVFWKQLAGLVPVALPADSEAKTLFW
jgi:hypothetical protein